MSKKKAPQLDVDYYMNEMQDEIMISVRTTDGSPITPQDILDAAAHTCIEVLGAEIEPVTAQDIKENPELH
jgi:hypothetical protein